MTRTRSGRTRDGEGGNVIISVLVIMVGTIAVVGLLASVASGLGQVRTDQSRAGAFQQANAGIDHALYRIDTQTLPLTDVGSYDPTVVGGKVTGFTDALTADGMDYQLTVAQDPPGQDTVWRVESLGTDDTGRQRLAVADIEATRTFENGFFTLNQFIITGTQFRNIPVAYDSSVPGCITAPASCELGLPVEGRLGTNDLFEGANATLVSLIEQWSGFNLYGRATLDAARAQCFDGDCHTTQSGDGTLTGQVFNIPEALEIETPPAPASAQPCPNGGHIGTSGTTTSLAPGDYNCATLNLAGKIVVNPPGTVRIWIEGKLSAAGDTVLNENQRPITMQLYQSTPADGLPYEGEICGSSIWGLLYTPGLEIKCSGSSQPTIHGAVVANLHDGAGNHFKFHWDASTRDALNNGKYHVENWRECPVSGAGSC